eukprot:8651143-Ditylum_brightwellii.AAC.2
MLGSHKAATLQENTEFEYIQAKAEKFLRALLPCYLQRHDVMTTYMTIYKPSITYSLCSASFSKDQIDKLHTHLLSHLLPKLGYQHTFPYEIAFGSKYAGGIGLMHISAHQLSAKIMGTLRHVRAATKVGHKFMLMLNWAQKSVGVQKTLLEDMTNLLHLKGKWLKQLQQDMVTADCNIILPNAWKAEPLQ